MPIKGDIISSSFAPQISLYNTAAGSNKLKTNIGEYLQAEYDIRIFWYAEPTVFEVFDNGGEIVRKDGKSFLDDSFNVGENINIRFNFGGSGQNGVGTISAISEDGFTMFSSVNSLTNGAYDSTAECLIVGISDLTECDYRFGLIENNESFNTRSKVTGEDQKYYIEDLQNGVPKFGVISGNIKGWASSIETIIVTKQASSAVPIFRGPDFGGVGGTVPQTAVLNYNLKHRFPIVPFYTVGQLQNIKNLVAPSFLAGNNSLKHVFETTFKRNISDEEANKKVIFDSLDGSTGFFDEHFNGLQSQYSLDSLEYFDNASGLPNDSLIVEGVTKVVATITSDDATFTGSTDTIVIHSYLPDNEEQYTESQDYFDENFAFENTPDGAGGSIITGVTNTFVNASTLEVEFFVDLSTVKPELTEESNYLLALVVQDETLTIENSDRTTLLLDVNTYDKNPDIPDLLIVDEFVNYDHVTDITNTGFTDYKGWIQDGYAVKGSFRLDRTKNAVLQRFFIDIVAWNDTTDEYFTIQSNAFNLSNALINGDGNQEINIQELQGFRLDELDQFNQKKLTTGTYDGTFISYDFQIGLKINWQDWLSLPEAANVFTDVSLPNSGKNQNSSRYNLNEGYSLKTILRAEVLESVLDATTEYIAKSQLNALDFDEIAADDWTLTITTKRDDTGADTNGKILTDSSTVIVATFTPNNPFTPDPNDFDGIIRLVETLPQGDKTINELSSVRTSYPNNPLIPLDGEPLTKVSVSGSSVILECRTDTRFIENVAYTISARLFGEGSVILGDYNDDFNNDFFV